MKVIAACLAFIALMSGVWVWQEVVPKGPPLKVHYLVMLDDQGEPVPPGTVPKVEPGAMLIFELSARKERLCRTSVDRVLIQRDAAIPLLLPLQMDTTVPLFDAGEATLRLALVVQREWKAGVYDYRLVFDYDCRDGPYRVIAPDPKEPPTTRFQVEAPGGGA